MSLYEDLRNACPDLTDDDFHPIRGKISLRNDSDGFGDYIEKWEVDLELPEGFHLGK